MIVEGAPPAALQVKVINEDAVVCAERLIWPKIIGAADSVQNRATVALTAILPAAVSAAETVKGAKTSKAQKALAKVELVFIKVFLPLRQQLD